MTKHMFRVFVGKGKMNKSDLETRTEDWVASNNPWEEDTIDHTLRPRNTAIDGSGETYYSVDVRFFEDDTKANLLQKLTDKLKDKVSWYRVGYHACPHDGTNRPVTESLTLETGKEVEFEYGARSGTVVVGDGSYTKGDDYILKDGAGNVGSGTGSYSILGVPEDSTISKGTYSVEYGTGECDWDDKTQWTAKDTTIPAGVPELI